MNYLQTLIFIAIFAIEIYNHHDFIVKNQSTNHPMFHSSLASLGRHATGLIASLSLCMAFNAAAQNANRYYYPVDKSLLEDFLSINYDDMYPFIIVDENAGMAAQATAATNYDASCRLFQ